MDDHGIWLISDFSETRSPTRRTSTTERTSLINLKSPIEPNTPTQPIFSPTFWLMSLIFFTELFLSAYWIANGAMLLDNYYTKFGTYEDGTWMIVCCMAFWKITRPLVAFLCRLYLNQRTNPVIARRVISCRNQNAVAGAHNVGAPAGSAEVTSLQVTSDLAQGTSKDVEVSSSTALLSPNPPNDEVPPAASDQENVKPRTNNGVVHRIDELMYVPTKKFLNIGMAAIMLLGFFTFGVGFIKHHAIHVVLFGISTGIFTAVISTCTRYHIKQYYRKYPYHIHKFIKQLARCTSLPIMSCVFPYAASFRDPYLVSYSFLVLLIFMVPLVIIQLLFPYCIHKIQTSGILPNYPDEEKLRLLKSRYEKYPQSPTESSTPPSNSLWTKFRANFQREPYYFGFFFIFSVLSSALIVEVFSLYLVSFPYILCEKRRIFIDPLEDCSYGSGFIALGWLPTVLMAYLGPHNSAKMNEWIARLPARNMPSRRLAIFILGLVMMALSVLNHKQDHFFYLPAYGLFGAGSAVVFFLEMDVFCLCFHKATNVMVPFIKIATGIVILIIHSAWLAITMEYGNKDFKAALTDYGHWMLLAVAAFWTVVLLCKTGKYLKTNWPREGELEDEETTNNQGAGRDAGNSGISVAPDAAAGTSGRARHF